MANFSKLNESELPVRERKSRELILKIREVATEIEFQGARDVSDLAWVLDRRKIRPLRTSSFTHPGTWLKSTAWGGHDAGRLSRFLRRYLPDLLERRSAVPKRSEALVRILGGMVLPHPAPFMLASHSVSKRPLAKSNVSNHLSSDENRGTRVNLHGWSIRKDRHGYFRAYRRVDGKVRSLYLGKTLDGHEEKLSHAQGDS